MNNFKILVFYTLICILFVYYANTSYECPFAKEIDILDKEIKLLGEVIQGSKNSMGKSIVDSEQLKANEFILKTKKEELQEYCDKDYVKKIIEYYNEK